MVLHVFISFLGGVPLCIPYGLYNGISLGGTTRGTLEGYPGQVLSPVVELLDYDLLVTSPLGHSVRVNRVHKNCPLMVHGREFSVDLIALPFHEFNLILGMDWLSKHRAIVDCDKKIVLLKCLDRSEVTI